MKLGEAYLQPKEIFTSLLSTANGSFDEFTFYQACKKTINHYL